jgi:hypothetical protein
MWENISIFFMLLYMFLRIYFNFKIIWNLNLQKNPNFFSHSICYFWVNCKKIKSKYYIIWEIQKWKRQKMGRCMERACSIHVFPYENSVHTKKLLFCIVEGKKTYKNFWWSTTHRHTYVQQNTYAKTKDIDLWYRRWKASAHAKHYIGRVKKVMLLRMNESSSNFL